MSHAGDPAPIDSLLREDRVVPPPPEFAQCATLNSAQEFHRLYRESLDDPASFWGRMAREELSWFEPWTEVVRADLSTIGEREGPYLEYFRGGKLNVSYNCLDRHLTPNSRHRAAIIWQGEPEGERQCWTYHQLHREVCRFAQVLRRHGAVRGSVVTIFMPMVPQLAVALLACARIGAIHSVVFSAFSAESLKSRIQDCRSSLLVTANLGFHAGREIELKAKADVALLECPTVKRVIVFDRTGAVTSGGAHACAMESGRDVWWHEEIARPEITDHLPAESLESEQPLFILYTSGSTGKPKGVLHTTAGYLLQAHLTFKYYFDYREGDLFWCTADVGWITGHSYFIYGPLSNGATCMMYEGAPTYPTPDRFWRIIAENGVTIFYTAPTAIRMLMRLGDELPARHDLSSLRLLGSVGEPINPEAWMWYRRVIGRERCPVIDTWWQTETGGIMISTIPGAHGSKPGSAGLPFFGVNAAIVRDDGTEAAPNEGGSVVIRSPWPGMIRGVYGDTRNELVKRTYFSKFPGIYFSGDGGRRDDDGYFWLLGRIDDVLNVSAHRLSTAEIESALVSHPAVAEAAVVGYPDATKGQGIYCFVTVKQGVLGSDELSQILRGHVRKEIGPIATPDKIQFCEALPKTRSGKIMRRILRKIAEGAPEEIGDVSTLADPGVVSQLVRGC